MCKFLLVLIALSPYLSAGDSPTLIYLVRHTEKVDESRDPGLSERGLERARQLEQFMQHIAIDGLYATQFQRTQKTVWPIAEKRGLELTVIDARNPEAQIEHIQSRSGQTLLIAGHSNTIPALIRLLGGPELTIDHDQYDDLFLVIKSGEQVFLQRFQLTLPPDAQ